MRASKIRRTRVEYALKRYVTVQVGQLPQIDGASAFARQQNFGSRGRGPMVRAWPVQTRRSQGSSRTGTHGNAVPALFFIQRERCSAWNKLEKTIKNAHQR